MGSRPGTWKRSLHVVHPDPSPAAAKIRTAAILRFRMGSPGNVQIAWIRHLGVDPGCVGRAYHRPRALEAQNECRRRTDAIGRRLLHFRQRHPALAACADPTTPVAMGLEIESGGDSRRNHADGMKRRGAETAGSIEPPVCGAPNHGARGPMPWGEMAAIERTCCRSWRSGPIFFQTTFDS